MGKDVEVGIAYASSRIWRFSITSLPISYS
jgi:hypothetical protein